jgi:steroid delta-isomerase-like uncharacterized protein
MLGNGKTTQEVPMSEAENKALALRLHLEVMNQGKLDVADEVLSPDVVWHSSLLAPEMQRGPEGFKMFASVVRAGFPDFRLTEEDTIAEGDKVVNRWTFRGTHQGEFMGIPATNKQVTTTGIDLLRIANGKIVEVWQNSDQLGMLQQLGAIPTPGQPGA